MFRKLILMLICVMLAGMVAIAEEPDPDYTGPENAKAILVQPLDEGEQSDGESNAEYKGEDISINTDSFIPDSLEDESMERMVIGSDDRVTVKNTSAYPYSAIAYMKVHARCGCDWTCSGFMVGPRGLLTGAHCVVCSTHHKTASRITFYFGYKKKGKYFYKYDGETNYWYGTDCSGTNYSEWDYAYIRLKKRVGDKTGWFGTATMSDSAISSKFLTVAGYRDGKLKYDTGFATVESPRLISYQADTEPGTSGCPVYYKENGNVYAVAINVASNTYYKKNLARRIDSWLFDDMEDARIFD